MCRAFLKGAHLHFLLRACVCSSSLLLFGSPASTTTTHASWGKLWTRSFKTMTVSGGIYSLGKRLRRSVAQEFLFKLIKYVAAKRTIHNIVWITHLTFYFILNQDPRGTRDTWKKVALGLCILLKSTKAGAINQLSLFRQFKTKWRQDLMWSNKKMQQTFHIFL